MVTHYAECPKYTFTCLMKPILVHIHVYYSDMWAELERCLRNLVAYPCEIYVTYVNEDGDFLSRARAFGHDMQLIKVENYGFDVAPFFEVLSRVSLENYSYVAKLHTKRDVPVEHGNLGFYDVRGSKWREYLLAPFATAYALKHSIRSLEKEPHLGMVAHHRLILSERHDPHKSAVHEALNLCARYNIPTNRGKRFFIAGTMFLCRAKALQPIVDFARQHELSFGEPFPQHDAADLAHQLERILGWIMTSQGYEISDVFSPWHVRACSVLRMVRYWWFHLRGCRRLILFGFISLPLPWAGKIREVSNE